MKQEIENRINELKEYVDKQRELIIGINDAIEHDNFKPTVFQQGLIDHICEQGRKGLKDIERLEKLKERFI